MAELFYTQIGRKFLESQVNPKVIRFSREEIQQIVDGIHAQDSKRRTEAQRKEELEHFLRYMIRINGIHSSEADDFDECIRKSPDNQRYLDGILETFATGIAFFPDPAQQIERIVQELDEYWDSEQKKRKIQPGDPKYHMYLVKGDTARVKILKQFVRSFKLGKKQNEDRLTEYLLEQMRPEEKHIYDSVKDPASKRELLSRQITDTLFNDLSPDTGEVDYRKLMIQGYSQMAMKKNLLEIAADKRSSNILSFFVGENTLETPYGFDVYSMAELCVRMGTDGVLSKETGIDESTRNVILREWTDYLSDRSDSCSQDLLNVLRQCSFDNRIGVSPNTLSELQQIIQLCLEEYDIKTAGSLLDPLSNITYKVLAGKNAWFTWESKAVTWEALLDEIRKEMRFLKSAPIGDLKEKRLWDEESFIYWVVHKSKLYLLMYQMGTAVQHIRGIYRTGADALILLRRDFSDERLQKMKDLEEILYCWTVGSEFDSGIAARWSTDGDIEKVLDKMHLFFSCLNQVKHFDYEGFKKLYEAFIRLDIQAFFHEVDGYASVLIHKKNQMKKIRVELMQDTWEDRADLGIPVFWREQNWDKVIREHGNFVHVLEDSNVILDKDTLKRMYKIYEDLLQMLECLAQQKIDAVYPWERIEKGKIWKFSWMRDCKRDCSAEIMKSMRKRNEIEMVKRADALGRGRLIQGGNSREYAYMMAFAYDMRVYRTYERDSKEGYEKCLDAEVRLFFEYLGNNLNRLVSDQRKSQRSYYASGFNYKNFLELAAVYYLMQEKMSPEVKWEKYQALRDTITKSGKRRKDFEYEEADLVDRTMQVIDELEIRISSEIMDTNLIQERLKELTEGELKEILYRGGYRLRGSSNAIQINAEPYQVLEETEEIHREIRKCEDQYQKVKKCYDQVMRRGLSVCMRNELQNISGMDMAQQEYLSQVFAAIKHMMDNMEQTPMKEDLYLYRERLIAAALKLVLYEEWHRFDMRFYSTEGTWMEVPDLLEKLKDRVNPILSRSRFQQLNEKNVADQIFLAELYYDYLRGLVILA